MQGAAAAELGVQGVAAVELGGIPGFGVEVAELLEVVVDPLFGQAVPLLVHLLVGHL